MYTGNIIADINVFQMLVSDWVNIDSLTADHLSTNHNIYWNTKERYALLHIFTFLQQKILLTLSHVDYEQDLNSDIVQ